MSQTTIPDGQTAAPPAGTIGDLAPHYIKSCVNAEGANEIPFGVLVMKGTGDDDAVQFDSDSGIPLGIVTRQNAYAVDGEVGDTGLKPGAMMGVMFSGTVYAYFEEAVTKGGTVRVRTTAGAGEVLGALRTTADSTDAAVVTGIEALESAGPGPVLCHIDMNGATLTADT